MTKVKICGITGLEDALVAVRFGADMVGLNFYPGSPRYVDPAAAALISRNIPSSVKMVGVFVNEPIGSISTIAAEVRLDMIQLHGDELPEFTDAVRREVGLPVIRAFRVGRGTASAAGADAVLLDAYRTGEYGGTGETFDWSTAVELKTRFPDLYLAGGLTPDNVAEAIKLVRPYAVDVASGVEHTPGKKDPAKVRRFIENAKRA